MFLNSATAYNAMNLHIKFADFEILMKIDFQELVTVVKLMFKEHLLYLNYFGALECGKT